MLVASWCAAGANVVEPNMLCFSLGDYNKSINVGYMRMLCCTYPLAPSESIQDPSQHTISLLKCVCLRGISSGLDMLKDIKYEV